MRRRICKCVFEVRYRRFVGLFGSQVVVQKREMSERSPRVSEMAGDLSNGGLVVPIAIQPPEQPRDRE
jgi:hypothetical protein